MMFGQPVQQYAQPMQSPNYRSLGGQYMNPNNNLKQWMSINVNNQLQALVNANYLSPNEANIIINQFEKNNAFFVNQFLVSTNNGTANMTNEFCTEFIGKIIQIIKNDLDAFRAREAAAATANFAQSVNNANMGFGRSPSGMNPMFNANQQYTPFVDTQEDEQPNFGARIRKRDTMPQTQAYATAMATPVQNATNTVENTIPEERIMQQPKPQSSDQDIFIQSDTPILVNGDYNGEFDPENSKTWSTCLLFKMDSIDSINKTAATKRCLKNLAMAEEYWSTKGIIWPFDKGFGIAMVVGSKIKARDTLPNLKVQEMSITNHIFSMPPDTELSGDTSKSISFYDIKSKTDPNAVDKRLYTIDVEHDALVWNDAAFLHNCGNGCLGDLILKGTEGTISINPKDSTSDIAVSITYNTVSPIYVPRTVFEEFQQKLLDIVHTYNMSYADDTYNLFTDVTDVLYDLPRKWSDRIDKCITNELNDYFSRYLRDLSASVIRAPYISNWVNVIDLYAKTSYNRLQVKNSLSIYRGVLASIVYQVLTSFTENRAINLHTEIETDESHGEDVMEDIFSNIELKQYIKDKTQTTHSSTSIANVLSSEDNDAKEELWNVLDSITILPLEKTTCFTTIAMNKSLAGMKGEIMFTPNDSHISDFEFVVKHELNTRNNKRDIVLIDRKNYTTLARAHYKLIKTLDNFIGYTMIK